MLWLLSNSVGGESAVPSCTVNAEVNLALNQKMKLFLRYEESERPFAVSFDEFSEKLWENK